MSSPYLSVDFDGDLLDPGVLPLALVVLVPVVGDDLELGQSGVGAIAVVLRHDVIAQALVVVPLPVEALAVRVTEAGTLADSCTWKKRETIGDEGYPPPPQHTHKNGQKIIWQSSSPKLVHWTMSARR